MTTFWIVSCLVSLTLVALLFLGRQRNWSPFALEAIAILLAITLATLAVIGSFVYLDVHPGPQLRAAVDCGASDCQGGLGEFLIYSFLLWPLSATGWGVTGYLAQQQPRALRSWLPLLASTLILLAYTCWRALA